MLFFKVKKLSKPLEKAFSSPHLDEDYNIYCLCALLNPKFFIAEKNASALAIFTRDKRPSVNKAIDSEFLYGIFPRIKTEAALIHYSINNSLKNQKILFGIYNMHRNNSSSKIFHSPRPLVHCMM
jgi:hypothetical protein